MKKANAGSISNPEVGKPVWFCWTGLLLFGVSACVAANWLTRDRSEAQPAHRVLVTKANARATGPVPDMAVNQTPGCRTVIFQSFKSAKAVAKRGTSDVSLSE